MKKMVHYLPPVGTLMLCAMLPSLAHSAPPASGAVMCDKCKMVVVKVANPTSAKNPTITYRDASVMTCPYCQSAMENFFKTGKLKHTCSHCGGTMTVCH